MSAAFRMALIPLLALCVFSCKETPPVVDNPPEPEIPAMAEPDFSIISITILKDSLVNTRLKVKLRIDNPNHFPVTLSAFSYELYGEGRFWADGTEKNILSVPASDYAEKDLFLLMNFIDMDRSLLDKVIAMERVRYRFDGSAAVNADNVPLALKNFSLEGDSEVKR